ncbi:SAM-dependent methyltransferase [Crossiella equi]|uniref:SAM-dependent methyltransferase n=1 Tax=Crossiella equi TaxID=130796 RepID=A0ABS5AC09_9PSEU|nr:methyltransferase domain-containing protein [Crossiella equi]MBP2474128.1 SAM-dependent methyltransferase [Crossiella equi]
MAASLPRIVETAFGHPRGLTGRIGAALLARATTATERELVAETRPGPTDEVLVLGPDLSLPDRPVDLLVTANTLHLWPDRDEALAHLYRALRPGGRLVLSTHRMLVPDSPAKLRLDVECAGFVRVLLRLKDRRPFLGPSYELTAARPEDR